MPGQSGLVCVEHLHLVSVESSHTTHTVCTVHQCCVFIHICMCVSMYIRNVLTYVYNVIFECMYLGIYVHVICNLKLNK